MRRYIHIFRLWFYEECSDALRLRRFICTGDQVSPSVSSDSEQLVSNIVSIFTKKPFHRDSPELRNLAPALTTKVVESVLNRFKSWKIAHEFFDWASSQSGYMHNCYTINALAAVLSGARRNAEMKTLSSYLVNSRCPMTPGALGFFIRCLGNVGMVEEADAVLNQAKDLGLCIPNKYTYNCLLQAISRSDKVEILEMRLKEMTDFGWELDKFTLTPVLQMYCNLGRMKCAMRVFEIMGDQDWLDVHSLSIMVLRLSKLCLTDEVFELIQKMESRNIRLNEQTFCILIHGFVKESKLDAALELFDKMKRSGFTPEISLYDTIIEGLCKKGQLKRALDLYLEMRESGISPDSKLLIKLSDFFSEEQMIQLLEELPEGMDTKMVTLYYNLLLTFYIKAGLTDKAHIMLRGIMGSDSNSHDTAMDSLIKFKGADFVSTASFNIVISGLIQKGEVDSAVGLFLDMGQVHCRPTVEIYNNLIEALCNSNKLDVAKDLLREMEATSGLSPTQFTHNCIFGCLCRREDTIGAIDMVKVMRVYAHEPWIKHSSDLVKRLCNKGRVTEACSFLADLVEEGFVPDIVAYSTAMRGLIQTHKIDQAMELFRDLQAQGCRPDVVAYNILISGLCKAKRVSEADKLFEEMLEGGLFPSVVTYNSMIDGWCQIGDVDRALLCLSKISRKAQEGGPDVITYTTLIDGLCIAGRPDEALTMWDEMKRQGCVPHSITFMAMIKGLSKSGRPEEARSYLKEMLREGMKPQIYVYVALLEALISEQKLEETFQVLREMLEIGSFPELKDKWHVALRDVLAKLVQDERTSSSIRALVAEGHLGPHLSDTDR
ncbi:hypothetical protein SAY86_010136 [Trapa natans]|uniref:Pentatricopeptide repeat-containing protein n=1 Tax=Trapa natans TaxID=22666 RepID=A0AAN7QRU3_TRANT|nr:hypothetical protein SAY86_010136 [Trapa natans]